jgi:galactokinase/mevalonate kinase-like predicted kinase
MTAAKRPGLRRRDLETAYAWAAEHGLQVRALRAAGDGGFTLDFGDPTAANDDALDLELARLEARHGQGRP